MDKRTQIEEQLDELSYLWTSGEWSLQCVHYSRARVAFVFPKGRPSPQELLAVRALVPRFANAPMSVLKAEVGNVQEFIVGEFGRIEARGLQAAAHARGLQTRTEDASDTVYGPVNGQRVLLIENAELASRVTEEMRRRGVPVVSRVEID